MTHSIVGMSAEQIAEWLKVLIEPDSTVEMRVAKDAVHEGKGKKTRGLYWLMNPLSVEWNGSPATDADIVRRRWLLIDCDPKRKGTVSSTDAEKEAARQKMIAVEQHLSKCDWPSPIIADAGNGDHLTTRTGIRAGASTTGGIYLKIEVSRVP